MVARQQDSVAGLLEANQALVCFSILKDGNVVASLHEGQFFGEQALLEETTRNASVRAQTYCDLYKLEKKDFVEIISRHPDLLDNMRKTMHKRSSDKR